MEATTEKIIANVLKQGVADGSFTAVQVALTASLIKPLLQDWYVKRAKYRRRGTSIESYINAVGTFVGAALSNKARGGGRVTAGGRSRPKQLAQH
jgi:hypothetical protein